jgi:chromosomal replication initiation ATPase DnaA
VSLSLLAGRGPQRQAAASEFDAASHELAARVRARIAARCGLTAEAVLRSNARPAVAARHVWLRVVRDTWDLTAAATGRLCGVDHTTVLAAVRRVS